MQVRNGVETMQTAAFKSQVKREGIIILNAEFPGPGSYDINWASVDSNIQGSNHVSKVGRASHYPGDRMDGTGEDCTTVSAVGPGSYE